MALTFFNNYVANIAVAPSDKYKSDMQNTIYKQWENSTQNTGADTGIQCSRQTEIGSKSYVDINVSIDMQIDLSTGLKKPDDFKVFSHKELSDNTILGLMYKFQDNYWITTGTDEYASPIKSVAVRRCNNIARWINPYNGALIEYPCVIEYDVSGTGTKFDKDINTANGHFILIIQGNSDTLQLTKNQRFIFNGEPYKLTGYNKMLQNGIVDDSTTLLYFDLYVDTIEPNDDVINSIANATQYTYNLNVLQDITEQVSGFVGHLTAQVTYNDEIVNRDVEWISDNENGIIDANGRYRLIGLSGTSASFICKFGDISKTIIISIVDYIQDKYDIVITPLISELLQGESVTFSANLYKNGIIQSDIVTTNVTGADSSSNYIFVLNGNNSFTLTNVLRSIAPLSITFNSSNINKNIQVKLKSMF